IEYVRTPEPVGEALLPGAVLFQRNLQVGRFERDVDAYFREVCLNLLGIGIHIDALEGEGWVLQGDVEAVLVARFCQQFTRKVKVALNRLIRAEGELLPNRHDRTGGDAAPQLDITFIIQRVADSTLYQRVGYRTADLRVHVHQQEVNDVARNAGNGDLAAGIQPRHLIRGEVKCDVDLAGFKRNFLGCRFGNVGDDNAVKIGGCTPVVRIANQHRLNLWFPAFEDVWTRSRGRAVQEALGGVCRSRAFFSHATVLDDL